MRFCLQLAAGQPTVDVLYGVTLPEASKNSLLLMQSKDPAVAGQFAGWYSLQMQAHGGALIFPESQILLLLIYCAEQCRLEQWAVTSTVVASTCLEVSGAVVVVLLSALICKHQSLYWITASLANEDTARQTAI